MKNSISLTLAEKSQLNETAVRILSNAIEIEDVLSNATKFANEILAIAARSQVTRRHLLTNKPLALRMNEKDADRSELLIRFLKTLSDGYTDRMRAPAMHVHRNQAKKYRDGAVVLAATDHRDALAKINKFMKFRDRFMKDGNVAVDFRDLQPSTLELVKSAIKTVKLQSESAAKDALWELARMNNEVTPNGFAAKPAVPAAAMVQTSPKPAM